jgi:hypothetical protein
MAFFRAALISLSVLTTLTTLASTSIAQESDTQSMQIALRRLTGEQEAYFVANRVYAASLDSLRGNRAASPARSSGIQIKILAGNAHGWAASATHPTLPRKSCVIVVGKPNVDPLTLGGRRATPRGAVVCDE